MREHFGRFGGRAWLNAAHQGPLPLVAAEAAHAAVEQKVDPRLIEDESFFAVPRGLRHSLARLVGGADREIVLGNSTSHGLDLLANGLPLRAGDEVLLVENDFPATVYPWLPLQRRGVLIRTLPAPGGAPDPDELRRALTGRTRVVCSSWVFSFNGHTADVAALSAVCRDHGDVVFVLNGSQAVGATPADVTALGVDALVSCGFKWLCGPYATGFTWLRPRVLDRLDHRHGYWLAQVDEMSRPPETYRLREDLGGAAHDVFATAHLATFPAWQRALDLHLRLGSAAIERHDQRLVQRLIDGLPEGWTLLSPAERPGRSTLVFLGGGSPGRTARGSRHLQQTGVDVAERAGAIRVSPHLYNTDEDIDRVLRALAEVESGSGAA
jgi:cysteine desulfurase/selenocysteine lyase